MSTEMMTKELADFLLKASRGLKRAEIFDKSTQRPFSVQSVTLPLTTARTPEAPYAVKFPFKSFYVISATDSNVSVNIRPDTVDSFQSSFAIKKNDVWNSDLVTNEAYIDWSAQSGKSITIVFFTDARFTSGSLINQISGGVSINYGSGVTTAKVAMTAAAAASAVLAADSTRLRGLVQNKTGGRIWLGASTVDDGSAGGGANTGIEVGDGDTFVWNNTGALYAYAEASGNIITMTET